MAALSINHGINVMCHIRRFSPQRDAATYALVDVHPGPRRGLLTVGNHQFPKPASDEQPIWQSQLPRLNRSHLRAHLHRYGVVLEDLLRPAKAAAFPLHDEIPKGVRGSIDKTRALRVAAIGCRLFTTRSPFKGVQRIEGIPQFPGAPALRTQQAPADVAQRCGRHHLFGR